MALRWKLLAAGVLVGLIATAGSSVAGDPKEEKPEAAEEEPKREEPRQSAGASAEVKAAKGVEDREPVDVSDRFDAGDRVWVWSRVDGAKDTTVRHVWKRNGTEIGSVSLKIGSNRWRTFTRRTVSAGSYTVTVQAEDDSVLGDVSFTVE